MGRRTSGLELLVAVSLVAALALTLYTLLIVAPIYDTAAQASSLTYRLRDSPFTLHDSPFAIPSYCLGRRGGGKDNDSRDFNGKLKLSVDPVGYKLAIHIMEHDEDHKELFPSKSAGSYADTGVGESTWAYLEDGLGEVEIIYPEDFLMDLMREDPLYEPHEELIQLM
ncbi:hypothetical protein GOP47_0019497 [Adiantum capillus-veneris]|uniref:Uncharacterized protein n=1 Tax=Adiantum capillus-veneris TaxID=13818 RepID=A0A9D4UBL0_ADICA|nr:hypothetical protein GOP47_0019497 [Adiantum capillus-veneris]